jgi:hypothetical protein
MHGHIVSHVCLYVHRPEVLVRPGLNARNTRGATQIRRQPQIFNGCIHVDSAL